MFCNSDRPLSAVDVYKRLSAIPTAFPDVLACFRSALTLPVLSASAERSFSAVRRIKDHLHVSTADSQYSNRAVITVERSLSDKL